MPGSPAAWLPGIFYWVWHSYALPGIFFRVGGSGLRPTLAAGFCCRQFSGYNLGMTKYLQFFLALGWSVAGVAAVQDLRQLEQQAKLFIAAEDGNSSFQYLPGRADPRLRLPACVQLPTAGWPAGQRAPFGAVELACANQGWRVLIPVTASEVSMGYATTRPLRAGDVLQLSDVKLVRITNRALLAQSVRDPAFVVGKAVRSAVPADSLLRENQLRLPIVVKMNQPVRVVVLGNGFSLGSDAIALGNAAVGERLNVRVSSGKVISGVVAEDLTIQISAP